MFGKDPGTFGNWLPPQNAEYFSFAACTGGGNGGYYPSPAGKMVGGGGGTVIYNRTPIKIVSGKYLTISKPHQAGSVRGRIYYMGSPVLSFEFEPGESSVAPSQYTPDSNPGNWFNQPGTYDTVVRYGGGSKPQSYNTVYGGGAATIYSEGVWASDANFNNPPIASTNLGFGPMNINYPSGLGGKSSISNSAWSKGGNVGADDDFCIYIIWGSINRKFPNNINAI